MVGFSVARARAAIVSIMRFTHKSCTGVKGVAIEGSMNAAHRVKVTATTFTVSWNCTNLRMLS